jgi:hypothetical protein
MRILYAKAMVIAWAALSASLASAGYVYMDYDANQGATLPIGIPDPEEFGWLDVYAPGNGAAVINDAGLHVNAWQIIDGVGVLPNPSYLRGLNPLVSEEALNYGFRFEAIARFSGESSAPSLGISLLLNRREYHLMFNITPGGDLQATLQGRPGVTTLTTGGTGRWAYHRFSLESAGGGSTDVTAMFDGQPIGAPWGGIGGQPGHADLVMFGSSNRAGASTGAMAYRSLKFEVGPLDTIPADADEDSDVDGFDLLAWQRTLGSRTMLAADSNRDGVVNATDLSIWRQQFGTTAPGSAASNVGVPEPAGWALALIVACSGLVATRSRRASERAEPPRSVPPSRNDM